MNNLFLQCTYFGAVLTIAAYLFGQWCKRKWKLPICNPLLIAVIVVIALLLGFHVQYDTYYEGAKYISYLLTPATVCLAIPLYEQLETLKKNWKAIIIGITSGVLASLVSILAMVVLFELSHEEYVTLLPKSITTAIGMDVSAELGGYVSITVAVIIITGVLGNVIGEAVLKLFRITDPVAKGIALGTASHAIGTSKAMELGEVEGALSSLSIVVAGIITVVGASVFAQFI